MKFSCVREKLAEAASIAERFTGKNITLPVLGSMLIDFLRNSIRITATNLEHAVQIIVNGDGTEGGSVIVPSKILSPLLQSLKEDTVDIVLKDGNLLIKTITRETKIHGSSTQDFPLIPNVKNNKDFFISAKDISLGLRSVLPAVSQSEFKPELCGVLWKVSPISLRLAATDTFRLIEKTITLPQKIETESFSFIIPSKTAAEIARVFDTNTGEKARVVVDDNQILFEIRGVSIISRLIDGKFPDYDLVIPKTYETTCKIAKQDFQDAIRGSGIFASKLQDVSISFQDRTIEITSANNEIGEYKTKPIADVQGKNTRINFNYRYLLDGINILHDDEVFFGCNSSESPTLLRNVSDGTVVYVVMPIRAV